MCYESIERVVFFISIVIIVIFVLLILFISYRVTFASDLPKTVYDFETESLKTGDILGVGYRHPFGWFVTAWSGSIWSHTGIVWRDPKNDEVFVLEAGNYGGKYNGVIKIPIVVWVRINKGSHIGLSRLKTKDGRVLCPKKVMKNFKKLKKYVLLDTYSWRWYRLLRKKPYFKQTRTNYTCYELIVELFQECGVIKKLYSCSSYFPTDIMEGRIDLECGYEYTKPILLNVEYYNRLAKIENDGNKKKKCCC